MGNSHRIHFDWKIQAEVLQELAFHDFQHHFYCLPGSNAFRLRLDPWGCNGLGSTLFQCSIGLQSMLPTGVG